MQTATPFLMFQGDAEAAIKLYLSVFPEGRLEDETRTPDGKFSSATLLIKGQPFRIFDSPIKHGFTFTPSFSIFIDCDSAEELDTAFARLSEGGGVLMAAGNHGFSPRFGWLADRFGVSWQLNLPEAKQ